MKIIHVCSYYNSAYKYQEYHLAKQQVKDGHMVYVITSDRNFPFKDYQNTARKAFGPRHLKDRYSIDNGVQVIRLPVYFEFRTRVILRGLYGTLKRLSPDILIIHGLLNFSTLTLLFRKIKAKYIFDEHMLTNQVDKSLFGRLVYWNYRVFIIPLIIKRATKIVAISEGCIRTLTQFYGFPIDKITLIPLGADHETFRFSEKKRLEVRHELGIDINTIVIIFTGKLVRNKGPEKISEALEQINIVKKIHILIVGNGPDDYKRELVESFTRRKHAFTIHPTVNSDELVNFFCAADIAVYPIEATISTVEASSCSLPIICTNEIPERYRNGNGFGIDPGNIIQLGEALHKLIISDELRKAMGKKGREYVEKELSWSKISASFLSS